MDPTVSAVWLGGLALGVAAVAVATALVARARARAARQSLARLEAELQAALEVARARPAGPGRPPAGVNGDGPDPGSDPEGWLRWIATGQELLGAVRMALRDHDRLRREAEARRREAERLRRELARLQADYDRLVRERRQFARALANFIHEPGPRALLDAGSPGALEDPASREPSAG